MQRRLQSLRSAGAALEGTEGLGLPSATAGSLCLLLLCLLLLPLLLLLPPPPLHCCCQCRLLPDARRGCFLLAACCPWPAPLPASCRVSRTGDGGARADRRGCHHAAQLDPVSARQRLISQSVGCCAAAGAAGVGAAARLLRLECAPGWHVQRRSSGLATSLYPLHAPRWRAGLLHPFRLLVRRDPRRAPRCQRQPASRTGV